MVQEIISTQTSNNYQDTIVWFVRRFNIVCGSIVTLYLLNLPIFFVGVASWGGSSSFNRLFGAVAMGILLLITCLYFWFVIHARHEISTHKIKFTILTALVLPAVGLALVSLYMYTWETFIQYLF